MASVLPRRAPQMILLLTFALVSVRVQCASVAGGEPEFGAAKVVRTRSYTNARGDYRMVEFDVRGRNLGGQVRVAATAVSGRRGAPCPPAEMLGYNVSEVWSEATLARYAVHLPQVVRGNLYFCLPRALVDDDEIITPGLVGFGGERVLWYHQGDVSISLEEKSSNNEIPFSKKQLLGGRNRRQQDNVTPMPTISLVRTVGVRVDYAPKEPHVDEDGIPFLLSGYTYTVRLFGTGFTEQTLFTLTQQKGEYGGACLLPSTGTFEVVKGSLHVDSVQLQMNLPPPEGNGKFYFCVRDGNITAQEKVSETRPFVHQGSENWLTIGSFQKMVPLWLAMVIIVVCLCFSALFSGLNLGLMSLDRTELKILCNTGTVKEKQYAKKIQPVRNHGNYLLCSILLGNVLVNSTFTILLDDLTSGLIAIVCSTLAIVMFGEITPQAICSRHGLAIGAKTIVITKVVMGITFPLSYPISKLLDVLLGEEIGSVYTRERLKELVKVTTGENDLDRDEVNIISGALELRKKAVADVMTKIEDAFMLDYEATLDFETVSEIMKSGYSRIPVFENDRKNIVNTLYIKDLAFVDPDDNTPLKTLCMFYQNPTNFVFEDVTLDIMFKDFKEGNKGHMAFVNRVNNEGEGDPFYETIGLITLEDVIEELIQAEIMDETDVFTDNRTKRRRNADRPNKQDFTVFAERRGENNRIRISPQLTLATYQYLSASVDQFKPEVISETILRRLLKQDIIYHIKKNKDWRNDPSTIIYQQAKHVDYFVLILEGRVEVTVGQENLMFESGPFTYFGTQALAQNVGTVESPSTLGSLQSLNMDSMLRYTFQPDYAVRACSEVLYMKVKRNLYMAAKRASLMEKSQKDNTTVASYPFDDEIDKCTDEESDEFELRFELSSVNDRGAPKLLHSLDDDSSLGRASPEPKSRSHHHNTNTNSTPSEPNNQMPTSPRTPSIKSHMSPTGGGVSVQRPFGSRELNGSVKHSSTADDLIVKEEEVSLLTKS